MASSVADLGPSVVTSPSVSFMGHSERLLGFFSSSKVSSSGQRFRILVFVPVVLLGALLEPGWGQWGWNRLGARLQWYWGLRGEALPGGPCFGLAPQVLTEPQRAFKETGQCLGTDGGQEPKG